MKLKDLAQRIEEQNTIFENATQQEKAKMVAQDCLDRIEIQQLLPNRGRFIIFDSLAGMKDDSVKDTLNTKNGFSCKTCAKGGLFMSYIGRVNKERFCDIDDYTQGLRKMGRLQEIFSKYQLSLIETAFEGGTFFWNDDLKEKDLNKAMKFYDKYEDETDRLKEICLNIVKNKGIFKL